MLERVRSSLCGLGAAVAVLGSATLAQAQVTLPDIGVDSTEYVTAAGTAVGTTLAACFGLFVVIVAAMYAWRLIRRAIKA